ncbi:unnamed protein product [Thelazia callipaeda]|uniref:Exocyst subunit Exo70 family protein n=1 Tax=Thelazia callipaeda TaxID=103827 RepID=A0A0N5CM63_THECL|nr:unnamed protein product [Thelazia callipaeda]
MAEIPVRSATTNVRVSTVNDVITMERNATSRKRKEVMDRDDNVYATFVAVLLKQRRRDKRKDRGSAQQMVRGRVEGGLDRFGRMPRGRWPLYRFLYCEKFVCAISFQEMKKQVNSVTTSIAGHPCSQKQFLKVAQQCYEYMTKQELSGWKASIEKNVSVLYFYKTVIEFRRLVKNWEKLYLPTKELGRGLY